MKTIILATKNSVKVKQLKDILSSFPVKVISLDDLSFMLKREIDMPKEDKKTYEDNARLKCDAIFNLLGESDLNLSDYLIISDDSGFEVSALDGFPGVISARWVKMIGGPDKARYELNERFNKAISKNSKKDSSARMRCFVCLFDLSKGTKKDYIVEGIVNGNFIYPPRGNMHMVYDSVFVPDFQKDGKEETAAEMDFDKKQDFSTRIIAFKKLIKVFDDILSG